MTAKQRDRLALASLALWNSRKAYLQHSPHGLDCQGEYYILRANIRAFQEWRRACAAAKREKRK